MHTLREEMFDLRLDFVVAALTLCAQWMWCGVGIHEYFDRARLIGIQQMYWPSSIPALSCCPRNTRKFITSYWIHYDTAVVWLSLDCCCIILVSKVLPVRVGNWCFSKYLGARLCKKLYFITKKSIIWTLILFQLKRALAFGIQRCEFYLINIA